MHFSEVVPEPKECVVGRGLAFFACENARRDKKTEIPGENHCTSLRGMREIVPPFGLHYDLAKRREQAPALRVIPLGQRMTTKNGIHFRKPPPCD